METRPRFNYIITIHNKEDLIRDVLTCILICARENSFVYPVLDGCTDRTESIVDELIQSFVNVPVIKVHTPDVHEILAINAGLRAAGQEGYGFNIILQDDVLLQDFLFEKRIAGLYEHIGPSLGFVSLRHGANIARDLSVRPYPFEEYVESAFGHGIPQAQPLLPGQFAYRSIAIKSPVCIPFDVVRRVGSLDERLAPFMCDDIEYSIRCLADGFQNGIFGMKFRSDVEWGTTRAKPDSRHAMLEQRNMELIRQWHDAEIGRFAGATRRLDIVDVPNTASDADKANAIEVLANNRRNLQAFHERQSGHPTGSGLRQRVRKLRRKFFSLFQ